MHCEIKARKTRGRPIFQCRDWRHCVLSSPSLSLGLGQCTSFQRLTAFLNQIPRSRWVSILGITTQSPDSTLFTVVRSRARTIASIYTSPECPFPWRPIIHNLLFGWAGPREFKPKGELAGADVSRNRQLARWRYHHNTSHVSQKIVMLGSCPSEAARTETRDDGAMISACLRCIRGVRSLVFHKRQGTLI